VLGWPFFTWGPTHVDKKTKGFYPFVLHIKGTCNAHVCDVKKKKEKEEKKEECVAVREREKRKEKGCFFLITSVRD
jgi:hypothetical protein